MPFPRTPAKMMLGAFAVVPKHMFPFTEEKCPSAKRKVSASARTGGPASHYEGRTVEEEEMTARMMVASRGPEIFSVPPVSLPPPPGQPRAANPRIEILQERFANRHVTREPVMTDVELHEFAREEKDWVRQGMAGPQEIRRIRESRRATIHTDDHWLSIPFHYQFHYLIAPRAFYTDDQPTPQALPGDDMYFPLQSLRWGAAYIHIDANIPIPSRIRRNAEELTVLDMRAQILPSILFICGALANDDDGDGDVPVYILPHSDLDRDVLWALTVAVIASAAETERRRRPVLSQSSLPLYVSLSRGVRIPTWLVLPDNVKVYTDPFLPSGSPLDPETSVLQVLPENEADELPLDVPWGGNWHQARMRLPLEPMQDLHRRHLSDEKGDPHDDSRVQAEAESGGPRLPLS